ncbi:methyl-accepting chemotaxis protein [Halomonas sp. PAMB 3264]|uniref:methyl-accepting chemotaxis protein n=1 Tax=Halomonas sp. PAMB 3264 TaxID=3075222 RepID=UPI0028A0EBA6|nr:methyl-accepting chemotaxis protein [Halomonas sp. PAMB 3264]WNL42507.1 methyl-accepting chemotaxis protein [Halomonas sp. PAMB 3264]
MLSSLRTRILLAALAAIIAALTLNGFASYWTVKGHNDEQIHRHLDAALKGNAQALREWVAARNRLVASLPTVVESADPLAALQQLQTAGDFMTTYVAYASSKPPVFSDGWQPPADYDPRQRPWYQQAVEAGTTIVTSPYLDMISGELVVSFIHPYYADGDSGRLLGVIGGDIGIEDVVGIVTGIQPTPSSFAFLVTDDGTIAAHPDSALALEPSTVLSEQLDRAFLKNLESNNTPTPLVLDQREKLLMGRDVGLGSGWELVVAMDEQEATAGLRAIAFSSLTTLIIVAVLTALGLGVLLSLLLRPLKGVGHAMDNIASGDGDLTQRLPATGKDEIARIAGAFNRFADKMETVLIDVRTSSETVHHAASEIALGGQDLSRRTDQTAASLQQTSASIEQINSTVGQTAASSKEANALSQAASEVAHRGHEDVSRVVSTMEEITRASDRIGEIVTLMDGIAFQTNLLALNASVEAARAGEHGRGFAVVAEEVRQLARRSSDAANDIKRVIEDSQARVHSGTTLVRNAGDTMQEIVTNSARITDVLAEITAATSEQSDGIQQVNIAVNDLDRMTQENAAMVEESTTAAEQLKEQADHLARTIASFTLSATTPALGSTRQTAALPAAPSQPAF